jgi:hypothetical protein
MRTLKISKSRKIWVSSQPHLPLLENLKGKQTIKSSNASMQE